MLHTCERPGRVEFMGKEDTMCHRCIITIALPVNSHVLFLFLFHSFFIIYMHIAMKTTICPRHSNGMVTARAIVNWSSLASVTLTPAAVLKWWLHGSEEVKSIHCWWHNCKETCMQHNIIQFTLLYTSSCSTQQGLLMQPGIQRGSHQMEISHVSMHIDRVTQRKNKMEDCIIKLISNVY